MNKEINIEDLRPIAVVDYNTIDDIKEFVKYFIKRAQIILFTLF